ncbi:MAG TPA: DegV family protein [Acholeplasmataceae bacterium]|nr:DegV family protein [Acholeplasmataceae bacterium]
MGKVAIISDVNAGLDYIGRDPGIPVLRSIINFGDEHLVDGIDITADVFYKRISEENIIPSTSAPTVGEAMDLLDKLIVQGYTDVIMYSISYELSSIGQMVETLKDEYEGKINIHVVNTKTATYMQGYLAVVAKEMADQGKSVEEIINRSQFLIDHSHAYFVVDDLKYLMKNGRLSGAAAYVGTILRIKPILEITKDGRIVSFEKVKTHRRAVERMIDLVYSEIEKAKKVQLFIIHSGREEDAKKLAEYFIFDNIVSTEIHMITPAVGAHIGNGVIGIGYYLLEI